MSRDCWQPSPTAAPSAGSPEPHSFVRCCAPCIETGLAPLRELPGLRRLHLWDTGDEHGLDLSPLADQPDLEIIVAPDQDVRGIDPSRLTV